MGKDKAEEYGRRNSSEEELLIKIKPTEVIWSERYSRMVIQLFFYK
jgi:hypothetical protein